LLCWAPGEKKRLGFLRQNGVFSDQILRLRLRMTHFAGVTHFVCRHNCQNIGEVVRAAGAQLVPRLLTLECSGSPTG